MKLVLVIPSLERGGAERILTMLAGGWAKRGDHVTLVVFSRGEAAEYPLDPHVRLLSLNIPNTRAGHIVQAVWRHLRRMLALRRIVRGIQPDVVISFIDLSNILTLLATIGLKVAVVVSERANPEHVPLGTIWEWLRRLTYPHATALVCQTNAMVQLVQKQIKVPGWAIPNPVELPESRAATPASKGPGLMLVGMGRLVPQKGFDLLLGAFSRVADRHPEWSLTIIGVGPLRKQLEEQAQMLGVGGRVQFAGLLLDPFPVIRTAQLFVFSSRFEGFGNALTEAMACGLPAISFDCPAGPGEIIRDGVDGILVPPEDVNALAAALDQLMTDNALRESFARRAPEVLNRFSVEKVLSQWDALFTRVALERMKVESPADAKRKQGSVPPG